MTHAWCRDPARDAAVRAAEDGRDRPLPTLGEAIAAVTKSMSGDAGGEEMSQGHFADAAERSSTVSDADGLRQRVAELEAASGGGEGEVANVTFHADDSAERARYVGMTVKPLRSPQPRGWLTQEERNGLGEIATYLDTRADCRLQGLGSMVRVILTRSTPPEVVLPDADCSWCSDYATVWRECLEAVRSSLAAAGVVAKEVQ